jgi:hypothetical protein
MVAVRSLLASCAIVVSCAPHGTPVDGGGAMAVVAPDAAGTPRDSAMVSRLELGTGAPGVFSSLSDGQQVFLQRGCQGSQHIFVSLRAWGFAGTTPRMVTISVSRVDDGTRVSSPYSLMIPFVATADGAAEVTGLTPVIEEPRDVLGRAARIRATVEDATQGVRVDDERRVVVQWGPDACRPHG